jgi:hypothetical protein
LITLLRHYGASSLAQSLRSQPRSGARMQPAAQAVGRNWENTEPQGRRLVHKLKTGRKKLVPDISLIVDHFILLEKRQDFLLKRLLFVMFFRSGDIFCDGCDIRYVDAEDSISGLARKI